MTARATTPLLDGATQIAAFKLVTEEQDNLVDILRRALDQNDGETATFAFSVLCAYWTMRGAHWEVVGFGRAFLEATRSYNPEAVDLTRAVDDRPARCPGPVPSRPPTRTRPADTRPRTAM